MTERIVLQRGTRVVVVGSSVVGPQGPAGGGGGGVTDGNKGDITVSGAGTVWSFSADMATQAELDAVALAKANTAHTHAEGDVTGLTAALAGKAPTAHTHVEGDVTGLTAALAGKAPTVHTHAQADVTNLVTDLAGKAPTVHTHAQADVTNLVTDLAGKAATVHAHAQSDVTNLVTDLAGKVGTGRTISTTAPLTGGGDLSANRTLSVSAASDTAAGVVELATTAETTTGTDTTRAVTAAGVKAVSDLLVPKALVDAKGDLLAATAADTVARLAVGTNGHVLTADSAEATGLKWAAAAGGAAYRGVVPPLSVGPSPAGLPGRAVRWGSNYTWPTVGWVVITPFYVAESVQFDAYMMRVETPQAGALFTIACYSAADWKVGTSAAKVAGTEVANVDFSTSGSKTITLSAVTLSAGCYWLAGVAHGSASAPVIWGLTDTGFYAGSPQDGSAAGTSTGMVQAVSATSLAASYTIANLGSVGANGVFATLRRA